MTRFLLLLTFAALAFTSHAQTTPAPGTPTPGTPTPGTPTPGTPDRTDMTAQMVFEKYFAALGGKDKLLTVNDITTEMSTETNGTAMMITREQKLPNKSMMSMNAMGMNVFTMTTDGTSVQRGGMQGNTKVEGDEAKRTIVAGMIFPELRYADNGVTSTLAGIEKVDSKDAYRINNTLGTVAWSDFYDVSSGLKVQSISTTKTPQGERSQTSTLSDYKAVDGIQFPMTMVQQSPRGPMTLSVDKVKVNKGIKDSEFVIK